MDYETNGYLNDTYPLYCPSDDSSCPYLDKHGMCRISDPLNNCTDFGDYWDSYEDYAKAIEGDEEDEKP